ncbi:MAG: phosphoribosyltransferase [Candidatus Nitrosotenuis sp.]
MHLSKLEFFSLLSYSTRGTSDAEQGSKTWRNAVKNDQFVQINSDSKLTSDLIADWIAKNSTVPPFNDYFKPNVILVPVPKSTLMQSGTLWVPRRVANALATRNLGKSFECLERVIPLPRASTSTPANRPKAIDHYNSMRVQTILSEPSEILLVDDVVTRGATAVGAANRLIEAFPNARIRLFVALRAVSPPDIFKEIYDPCLGIIELRGDQTYRRP